MDKLRQNDPTSGEPDGGEDQSRVSGSPATTGDLFDMVAWLEKRLNGLQGGSEAITEHIFGDLAGIRAECYRLSDQMDAQAAALRKIDRALRRRPIWIALITMLLTCLVIALVVLAIPDLREAVIPVATSLLTGEPDS